MGDEYVNPTGLAAIRNWIKNRVNTKLSFSSSGRKATFTNSNASGEIVDIQNINNDKSLIYILANGLQTTNYLPTETAVDNKLATKQDTLVSGSNIKTINNESLLGGGNIDMNIPRVATVTDDGGFSITGQNFNVEGEYIKASMMYDNADHSISVFLPGSGETRLYDSDHVDAANAGLQSQIDALGEPFRLKQWGSNTLNVEIPACTEDISNTAIPKMVFSIDNVEGADYQIAGMIAYEVFDAASGGNRINCWPVCQFTGNGQKELSVRWMCSGTTRKTAKRINAWVLLKHR